MEIGLSPKKLTTKKSVKYRKSSWKLEEFEVWSGELLCKAVTLYMNNSLLVWLGGREPELSEISLAMPDKGSVIATTLIGSELGTASLSKRLAAVTGKQVYVCSGQAFDRFTAPLVEQGIVSKIKAGCQS